MDKTYESPELQVIELDTDDTIRTSNPPVGPVTGPGENEGGTIF